MTLPYRSRLMTVIDGTAIELARFKRRALPSDIRFYTNELSTPWWQENPLTDYQTITSRWSPPMSPAALRSRAAYALKQQHERD